MTCNDGHYHDMPWTWWRPLSWQVKATIMTCNEGHYHDMQWRPLSWHSTTATNMQWGPLSWHAMKATIMTCSEGPYHDMIWWPQSWHAVTATIMTWQCSEAPIMTCDMTATIMAFNNSHMLKKERRGRCPPVDTGCIPCSSSTASHAWVQHRIAPSPWRMPWATCRRSRTAPRLRRFPTGETRRRTSSDWWEHASCRTAFDCGFCSNRKVRFLLGQGSMCEKVQIGVQLWVCLIFSPLKLMGGLGYKLWYPLTNSCSCYV